jgi:hypothetical protein
MDIIVTTPKTLRQQAAAEAEAIKLAGGGEYFRRLSSKPYDLRVGDRVWYVEDGYIRGYALVIRLEDRDEPETCLTTGKVHGRGFYVYMDATTWTWVDPVEYTGFQGWRYLDLGGNYPSRRVCVDPTPVGDWLSPMPETPKDREDKRKAAMDAARKAVTPEQVQARFVEMLRERKDYLKPLATWQIEAYLRRQTLWQKLSLLNHYCVNMGDAHVHEAARDVTEGRLKHLEKRVQQIVEHEAAAKADPLSGEFVVDSWWYDEDEDKFAQIQEFDRTSGLYGIMWAANIDHRWERTTDEPRRIDTCGGEYDFFRKTDAAVAKFRPAYEGIDFIDGTDYD